MNNYIRIFLISILIYGCNWNDNDRNINSFIKPKVVNSNINDSLKSFPFKVDHVSQVLPIFAGKFKFSETIDIKGKRDSTLKSDFLRGYPNEQKKLDSLGYNGLELIVDYDMNVPIKDHKSINTYYPVYFINSTKSDKLFSGKDSHVYGIQEAIDSTYGRSWGWRPIEGVDLEMCANGTWDLIIHPNEFIVILMRKYEGNFKTKLKVRISSGENLFTSKPFDGWIDTNQFLFSDKTYFKKELIRSNGKSAYWMFYGAEIADNQWMK